MRIVRPAAAALLLLETLASTKPDIRRLVGAEGKFGEGLGLTNDWATRIVRQVGNYREIYERNLGTKSKLGYRAA
jgi:general L-amino acid transport system substrate-binding protein